MICQAEGEFDLADCGRSLPPQDAAIGNPENPRRFRVLPKWKKAMGGFFHGQLGRETRWAAKDCECLRHVFLKPGGQSWGGLLMPRDHLFEAACRLWLITGIEDTS